MTDKSSINSGLSNNETKLFGEVPLSDSENNSPSHSTNSAESVRAQNELNNTKNNLDKTANGTAAFNSSNGNIKNGKTILDVAVIDIDEGEYCNIQSAPYERIAYFRK